MSFTNRTQAGRELSEPLREMQHAGKLPDPLVLALPRGGVPVAREVARALKAPLDILVARKIGLPGHPEFGIGAIAGEDPMVYDEQTLASVGLSPEQLGPDVARERAELHRREDLYRDGRPATEVTGRSVVLVDDGLATGVTARAALRRLRQQGPARLVLAVPVGAPESVTTLREEADTVVCLSQPYPFQSVGLWYGDFPQVSDAEVIDTLHPATAR